MNQNIDVLRLAVEGTHPNNTVLCDDMGQPSFMVRIPKFKISDVIPGGSDATHPAFIVNGVEVPEIYIGKYQATVENDRAYSLPGRDPQTHVTFDEAKAYCENKGKGWHLMTNAEWAAIALWCQKNGFVPRGNTGYGKSHSHPHEHGVVTYTDGDGNTPARVATGSGPVSWAHDNSPAGIFDLCGNAWEWVSGLRILNGQIQLIPDNNSAAGVDESPDSALWRGVSADGEMMDPTAAGCLYFDYDRPGDDIRTDHIIDGGTVLNNARENLQYTGGDTDAYYGRNCWPFKSVVAKKGVHTPELLKVLDLMPLDGYDGEEFFYLRNYGERMPLRGGHWNRGAAAGMCAIDVDGARNDRYPGIGFRAAFVNL